MAFKKGVSGNPGGKAGDKIFTEALRVAVNRADGKGRKKIAELADTLVSCALDDREGWAFNLIYDRLEGKAVQPVSHTLDEKTDIEQFTDAELQQILRERLAEEASKKAKSKLHPTATGSETLN